MAPTFGHVLLAFRHKDAAREARGNGEHVIVGLFRDVPQADLELLMPHTQVQMPPLQRASFALMAATGAFAGLPLLTHWGSDGANNWVQLVTLYAVAAVALRTSLRWRFSKQYYQQLLVSHQHSNRVGSADGALLYVARLAEEEQRTRAALALHALLDAQRRAGLHGGEAIELGAADLAAASERLLASSAALRDFGLAPHVSATAPSTSSSASASSISAASAAAAVRAPARRRGDRGRAPPLAGDGRRRGAGAGRRRGEAVRVG